ncbi:tetratricopeptide repeat protein [Ideonella sp. YS5]|uniref:tetratricopeptide repeat protein n=1 Tax=Ideonella sp. YS5 TaxID=3453714 RepID=UPI003EEE70CC
MNLALFVLGAALLVLPTLAVLSRPLLATGAPVEGPPERGLAVVVASALVVAAIGLYGAVGSPSLLRTPRELPLDATTAALAREAAAHPHDASTWHRLARAHEAAHRFDAAVPAYRHLLELQPDDPDLLVEFAVTLAMSSGQHLAGEPAQLIDRALAVAPDHAQALALAGSVLFEQKDYRGAMLAWRRVQARLPADAPEAAALADSIAKAEALAVGR